jgi:hypothetical protein
MELIALCMTNNIKLNKEKYKMNWHENNINANRTHVKTI